MMQVEQTTLYHNGIDRSYDTYTTSSSPTYEVLQNDDDIKRVERLTRNRLAARRNRVKKKEWISGLQNTAHNAKDANSRLKITETLLLEEFQDLKRLLLELGHTYTA